MEDNILKAIKEVAKAEKINLDFSKLNTTLKDLRIDSLAAMNLIMKIEEKLGVTLSDDILLSIKTLEDLINAFEKNK